MIAVGGTSIFVNSSTGLRTSESTWSGSGGGVSVIFAKPSWQTGTGVPAGSFRCVPDVSFPADPNTGAYVTLNGAVNQYGGTSWSAPTWAGFCALINEARVKAGKPTIGHLNPLVYPLIGTSNFFDITTGNNATSTSGGKYAATVGYDQATGVGSPNMTTLLNTLVAQRQFVAFDAGAGKWTQPAGGSDIRYAPTNSCTYTNTERASGGVFWYDRDLTTAASGLPAQANLIVDPADATYTLDLFGKGASATIADAIAARGGKLPPEL